MPPSIPVATYRLQLTADFSFDQAAALVPYLKAHRDQSSLFVAISQGARRQHTRI